MLNFLSLIVSLSVNLNQFNSSDLMDVIMLDNGSTTSLFGNPCMVKNIEEAETPLELMTNGGKLTPIAQRM